MKKNSTELPKNNSTAQYCYFAVEIMMWVEFYFSPFFLKYRTNVLSAEFTWPLKPAQSLTFMMRESPGWQIFCSTTGMCSFLSPKYPQDDIPSTIVATARIEKTDFFITLNLILWFKLCSYYSTLYQKSQGVYWHPFEPYISSKKPRKPKVCGAFQSTCTIPSYQAVVVRDFTISSATFRGTMS